MKFSFLRCCTGEGDIALRSYDAGKFVAIEPDSLASGANVHFDVEEHLGCGVGLALGTMHREGIIARIKTK